MQKRKNPDNISESSAFVLGMFIIPLPHVYTYID